MIEPGPTPSYINTYNTYFMGGRHKNLCSMGELASRSWHASNEANYYPFYLPFTYRVKRFFICGGTGVGGNWSIGIYDRLGAGIYVSSGFSAVSQGGTPALDYHTPGTPFLLEPGRYFLGISADSTVLNKAYGSTISAITYSGAWQQSTAYPLPASATFATPSFSIYQFAGFTRT